MSPALGSKADPDATGARSRGELGALETSVLVEHLVRRHHGSLRSALPSAERMALKVARVHGARDARLCQLASEVSDLAEILIAHIDYEERVVFPELTASAPDQELVAVELHSMEADRVEVQGVLERLRSLVDGYRVPAWACATVRALWMELERIERQVSAVFLLESEALTPRFAITRP
jgi:regulator of cell morphogenesis and NO signaling